MSPPTTCALCTTIATEPPLYAEARWQVHPIEPPTGVAGWLVLVARRHVDGPAALDDDEAVELGALLRRCTRALAAVTGAERIYTAALGEKVRHLHVHLVPRGDDAPRGFALFDRQRAAQAGEVVVDPAEVARVSAGFAAAMLRGG
jgi:diadenosine tetraphosphate (Ap4A) HIT family hydrolase